MPGSFRSSAWRDRPARPARWPGRAICGWGRRCRGHVLQCFAVREAQAYAGHDQLDAGGGVVRFDHGHRGQQSGAAEDPVYFLAQHRVLRGQDPVFVDQFRQRHGPARFGEPMVRGRDELVVRFVEFFLVQRHLDGFDVLRRVGGDESVGVAFLERGEQFGHGPLDQLYVYARPQGGQAADDPGHDAVRDEVRRADADQRRDLRSEVDFLRDASQFLEDLPRAARGGDAVSGRRQAARGAHEQLHAQDALDFFQHAAQGGLGDVHFLRGSPEAAFARQREEQLEMAKAQTRGEPVEVGVEEVHRDNKRFSHDKKILLQQIAVAS